MPAYCGYVIFIHVSVAAKIASVEIVHVKEVSKIGQYHKIRCPICGSSLETAEPIETCPACKVYIGDKLHQQGGGTGINTACTAGPGLKPLIDLEQDVY